MNTRPFQVVLFDCDSTLSKIEGIDELAKRAEVAEQLVPLTRAAMEGSKKLEEIYAHRLRIIQPTQSDIEWLAQRYQQELVADAVQVVETLLQLGKQVHIISGGLRQAIIPLGKHLGIAEQNIHAVDIQFKDNGDYAGFDVESVLAENGGKAKVAQTLLTDGQRCALIGDGVTDLEVDELGVVVIGFGGVVRREEVVRKAAVFVDGPGLSEALTIILTPEEKEKL